MPDLKEIRLQPTEVNRSISPEDLDPSQARILNRIEVNYLFGRLRRGKGSAKTQVTPTSGGTTVTSIGVVFNNSCKRFIIDGSTAGTVRITPSDGSVQCSGPLPLWTDAAVDEDAGIDQAGSGGGYSGGY